MIFSVLDLVCLVLKSHCSVWSFALPPASLGVLTLKAPIKTGADDSLEYFSEKIRLDISFESSARQRIHMKHQALLFPKLKVNNNNNNNKSVVCCIFALLFKG